MKYLKAFVAGMAFPAVLLPLVYSILYFAGHEGVRTYPLHFMALYIPLIYGLWNVFYFWLGKGCPVKKRNTRLFVHGAALGLLVSLIGVFVFNIPYLLFYLENGITYMPILLLPVVYGCIWRYVVKYMNDVMGLKDW